VSDQSSLFGNEPPPPPKPKRKAAAKAPAGPPEPPPAPSPPSALPPQAPPEDLSVGPRCIVVGCIGVRGRCAFHHRDPAHITDEPPASVPIPDQGWVKAAGLWHYLRTFRGVCGFEALAFPASVSDVDPAGPGRLAFDVCGRCYRDAGACVRCKVPAGCAQHNELHRACTPGELEW
jgi:hypothetical protein